jgi:hypothetical protein
VIERKDPANTGLEIIRLTRTTVQNGGAVFTGPDSVVDQLSAQGLM